jgi:hypothetical protein
MLCFMNGLGLEINNWGVNHGRFKKKIMFKEKALLSFIIKNWNVDFYCKRILEIYIKKCDG